VTGITGVLDHRYGVYRIEPGAVGDFVSVNTRTETPDPVHGRLIVASFNCDYFNGDGAVVPDSRGAESTRVRSKEAKIERDLALNADIADRDRE
jgi:predicted extracellular nuclease